MLKRDAETVTAEVPAGETPLSADALSRRSFFKRISAAGLAAAAPAALPAATATPATPDGTPEQIHLTWGDDPTTTVVVSWASAAQANNARVLLSGSGTSQRVVHALQRV